MMPFIVAVIVGVILGAGLCVIDTRIGSEYDA
jgi:hypothetical protein